MEQIAKIQEQIENKPWKTAITIYKNGKSIFENSLANTTYKSASLIKLAIALYIQENIYSQLNVEDICYHFSISRSTIQTLFLKNLNTTPKQYISDLKFAKAKQMIKDSTYSISEIARICGFSSIHYFSRVFKEKYGITPTSYAKSIG